MYQYDDFDHAFVRARVAQFRDQVRRRLSGDLTEEQFRPLRLMNGVYLQLHAYMLRIAIPYGTLNARQMRKLAHLARTYDKGFGHFTTRQNLQLNWPALADIPDMLDELADVEMHAIQTSGNCIRNVTTDQFAGAAADEVADPRPYAEILRQWSSLHPEFTFLPRKFKIAISAAEHDRAAIRFHDIGLKLVRNAAGDLGFTVFVGGGMGRTPFKGWQLADFVPEADLLAYAEAVLRVYNLYGRRDNKYKARIKILMHEAGFDAIKSQVEAEFQAIRDGALKLTADELARMAKHFVLPEMPARPAESAVEAAAKRSDPAFARWGAVNVRPHKRAGYASVTISLKPVGGVAGDATAEQMELMAELAERYGFSELRISHAQNVVLPHVARDDLKALYDALRPAGLATANLGLASDMIVCPGLDYCALANARSIPVAQRIAEALAPRETEIGPLAIKVSGCINACGHHHAGHIGILGVDRKGEEFYQVTLGGSAEADASIGEIVGRGFSSAEITGAIETVVETYLARRASADEPFLAAYRRLGAAPFKEALYGAA